MDHLCYLCILFVMLSRLFIAALWPPAGKWLTVCLSFVVFNCVFVTFPYSGLEISENRHLPCITKFIGIHGENLIFSRNIKIFTCPAA